ncbi:MAG: glycosyltransferase family 2 protein [Pseudomonadota bacterium]
MPPVEDAPRVLLMACARNEAPYLPEWIAWHRLIGVQQILVYTNDCSDGTVRMLQRMQQLGLATHAFNTGLTRDGAQMPPQQRALRHVRKHPLYAEAEWFLHIDIDEFLVIHAGDGRIAGLLAEVPEADVIPIAWKLFGPDGRFHLGRRLLTEGLVDCEGPSHAESPPRTFKALTRLSDQLNRYGVHRPGFRAEARRSIRWRTPAGRAVDHLADGGYALAGEVGDAVAQLNHYALRTYTAFLGKQARGSSARPGRAFDAEYAARHIGTGTTDLALWHERRRLRTARDDILADPTLAALWQKARSIHAMRTRSALRRKEGLTLLAEVHRLDRPQGGLKRRLRQWFAKARGAGGRPG